MNNENNRDNSQQPDISKAQSAMQPQAQSTEASSDQLDADSESQSSSSGSSSNIQDEGSTQQSETTTQNRSDVEGSSLNGQEGQQSGGFVGSASQSDTSSELVADDESQAPEGK